MHPDGLVISARAPEVLISNRRGLGVAANPSSRPTQSRPNGPGCDLVCRQATETVNLAGGLIAGSTDAAGPDSDIRHRHIELTSDSGTSDTGTSDTTTPDTTAPDTTAPDTTTPDAGLAPGCCNKDKDCAVDEVCKGDVCKSTKSLSADECWTDAQCKSGPCKGANVCGCGLNCFAPDKPGKCDTPNACVKLDPSAYGMCDMLLGVGWDGGKCTYISGCGCKGDCDKLFKTMDECKKACTSTS